MPGNEVEAVALVDAYLERATTATVDACWERALAVSGGE
jgi:hypothetical protein